MLNADVIVIGVGGMGSSACYHLAKNGVSVLGLEQFDHGHPLGSSHGQSRILRKAYFEHPNYVPLLHRAYEAWHELELKMRQKVYHETGIIYFCPKESELLAGLKLSAEKYDIEIRQLTADDRKEFDDRFTPDPKHLCVYEPKAGFLEVEKCTALYTAAAKDCGAQIVSNETVKSWHAEADRVSVHTDKGEYTAKKLIVTAGAWTTQILRDLNLPLHILKKMLIWLPASPAYHEKKNTPCFFFEKSYGVFYGFAIFGEKNYIKIAEHTGGRKISNPMTLNRSLEKSVANRTLRFVQESLPQVRPAISEHAACMYTMTPDSNFIIDLHPKHKNVAFACGFSGHGFKFASVIGEVLADLATTERTDKPIDFLRLR
jgi:sarcosine oxidase